MKKILFFLVAILASSMVFGADSDTVLYGMQDSNLDDSQFFSMDLGTMIVTNIGSLVNDVDIEAMDTNPIDGKIYGLTGDIDDGSSMKKIVVIDKIAGIPDLSEGVQLDIGANKEYQGASFRPGTEELWAGGDNLNIRKIDITTGNSVIVKNFDRSIEGMAWTNDGELLYIITQHDLYSYDPNSNTTVKVCDDIVSDSEEMEGLEYDNEDNLVVSYDSPEDEYNLDIIDVENCQMINSEKYQVPKEFYDVETFTFDSSDNNVPEFGVVAAAVALIGAVAVFAFKRK